jgi:hypothetical protein
MLGISVEQMTAALAQKPILFDDRSEDLRWPLGKRGLDKVLIVDLALAIDHLFGFAEGYFLGLRSTRETSFRAWKLRRWPDRLRSSPTWIRKKGNEVGFFNPQPSTIPEQIPTWARN